MAQLEREYFDECIALVMARFDSSDKAIESLIIKQTVLYEGEKMLDNQDICQLLNVSKRTLQRYRSLNVIPYQRIYNKTLYKESDVQKFMKDQFADYKKRNRK